MSGKVCVRGEYGWEWRVGGGVREVCGKGSCAREGVGGGVRCSSPRL